jgi:hypothetical protein
MRNDKIKNTLTKQILQCFKLNHTWQTFEGLLMNTRKQLNHFHLLKSQTTDLISFFQNLQL